MKTSKIPEHIITHDATSRYCTGQSPDNCGIKCEHKAILTSGIQKELKFTPLILMAPEVPGICNFPWQGKLCSSV